MVVPTGHALSLMHSTGKYQHVTVDCTLRLCAGRTDAIDSTDYVVRHYSGEAHGQPKLTIDHIQGGQGDG